MPRVKSFYNRLLKEAREYVGIEVPLPLRSYSMLQPLSEKLYDEISFNHRQLDSSKNALWKKLYYESPGEDDINLLAETLVLQKDHPNIKIVSTDTHFVSIKNADRVETFVPDAIRKELGVDCEWPDDFIRRLRNI